MREIGGNGSVRNLEGAASPDQRVGMAIIQPSQTRIPYIQHERFLHSPMVSVSNSPSPSKWVSSTTVGQIMLFFFYLWILLRELNVQ